MPLEAADGNPDAAIAVLLDGFRAYDRFPDLGKRLLDTAVTEIFLLCGHIPRLHLRGAGNLSGHAATDGLKFDFVLLGILLPHSSRRGRGWSCIKREENMQTNGRFS